MKKIGILAVCLLSTLGAFAQLSKTKAEVIQQYGNEKVLKQSDSKPGYTGILFGLDSVRYLQVTFKGDKVVMLNYMHADSALSEQQYQEYINQNIPGLSPKKNCPAGGKSYLIDQKKEQLVQQTHAHASAPFPLLGVIIATDPAMVNSIVRKVGKLCQ